MIELLASSLQKTERARAALGPHAAALLDAGGHNSMNPKHWPCEDSLALASVEGGVLALVADSHWGGAASECAAKRLVRSWERAKGPNVKARLAKTLLLIEAAFQQSRRADDRSDTTVLIAHVSAETLTWVNVGDSFLWVHAQGALELINQRSMNFLGRVPLAVSSAMSSGSRPLAPGERVVLASDGIEPPTSGLEVAEVAAFLEGHDLAAGLESLANRACDESQGGGRDNLALIWIDPREGPQKA